MKQKKNAGFSLVELIIVIAIMAVLVGLLAPQFIKYVETSRRAVDIQNADAIREAMLAEMADQMISGSGTLVLDEDTLETFDGATLGALNLTGDNVPRIKGSLTNKGGYFYVEYDAGAGSCHVYNSDPRTEVALKLFELTNASQAAAYKDAR